MSGVLVERLVLQYTRLMHVVCRKLLATSPACLPRQHRVSSRLRHYQNCTLRHLQVLRGVVMATEDWSRQLAAISCHFARAASSVRFINSGRSPCSRVAVAVVKCRYDWLR